MEYRLRQINGSTVYLLKIFLGIFFLSFTVQQAFPQSYNQLISMAKKHAARNDFLTAAQLMEEAYRQSPTPPIAFKCADYYFEARNYKKAERYYRKVILSDPKNYPEAYFRMAMAEKYLGKYVIAAKNFWRYFFKFPGEPPEKIKIAQYQKYSCEEVAMHRYEEKNISINPFKEINSPYSEFVVYEVSRDSFLFSSFRPRNAADTINFFSAVYAFKDRKTSLIDTAVNFPDAHIANFCYDDSLHLFLFTACQNSESKSGCKIFSCKYENGKFTKPKPLNDAINYANSNNTQPFLCKIKDTYYLFFASDRENGFGGYDLYYSMMNDDGSFSIAINLGDSVNSPMNEITPFYDIKNNDLYFSSQWYVNYGGYDIFKSHGTIGEWSKPENLGEPLNSTYDDVFYSENKRRTRAFFSSNRPVTQDEEMQCCNDIYIVKLKEEPPPPVPKEVIIERMKKDLKLMVPLTLYYDNDQPNPRSLDTVTQVDYKTAYDAYLQKIDEYKKEYSKGKKGQAKQNAILSIENFFQDSVIAGYEQFQKGLSIIEQLLKEGQSVELIIKGFASPLNKTAYNANLSKRRIACVENYIRQYNDGVFLPYLDTTAQMPAKLIILRNAFGETKASATVSDKLTDLQNSVYSPAAAKERKVQIIGINFK